LNHNNCNGKIKMEQRELILDELVIDELDHVREILRDTKVGKSNLNLYTLIFEELTDSTKNSVDQVNYLEILEEVLTVFKTTSLSLREEMNIVGMKERLASLEQSFKDYDEKEFEDETLKSTISEKLVDKKEIIDGSTFFSNRYALYLAGRVGLAMLNEFESETKNKFSFDLYNSIDDSDKLTTIMSTVISNDFLRTIGARKDEGNDVTDDELKYLLQNVFTSMVGQFNMTTYQDVVEKHNFEDLKLRYKHFSLQGDEFKAKSDQVIVDDKFMPVRKEDVIGEQEFTKVLWDSMVKLSCYNQEEQTNPFSPPSVIFTFGQPGGGKTYIANAYIQSLGDLCREKNVPLWVLTHSTTDYASHYQNLTANKLQELAREIKDFPGIVVMYVADADNIFQSRKDPRLSSEQRNTSSVYFKMFDGTMIPKNGRFMAIMDANYVEEIDDATKSRLFDKILELKRFDKADNFSELAKRSLCSGLEDYDVLTPDEWTEVGEYILESPLSNREIGHVLNSIKGDYEVPESMVGLPYLDHVEYRNEKLHEILTKDNIVKTFQIYIETRMEIERKSREDMKNDDYNRFVSYLETEHGGKTA
jgi:SpoVK/Ycf46/Vps4 family AAA+-type ATPase